MNTSSMAAKRCLRFSDPVKEGEFLWGMPLEDGTRSLYFVLPGGARVDAIAVRLGEHGASRVWGWDGNEDAPTLSPSILVEGLWHGHLRAGRFESC